jgi:putative transposase
MPPWRTVHGWFGRWLALGLFDRMMRATWRACAAVPRGGGQSLDWQSSAPRRWKCLPVRGPRGLRMAILDGAFTAGRRCEWSHLHGTRHEVVARLPDQRGFAVLPRRWVAERSFGWLTRWGSLLRDRAGRLDVAADCTAVLAATETPVNPA